MLSTHLATLDSPNVKIHAPKYATDSVLDPIFAHHLFLGHPKGYVFVSKLDTKICFNVASLLSDIAAATL